MPKSVCHACLMPDTGFDVCPYCGWQQGLSTVNPQHLAPGTMLKSQYRIARVLGHGGFGITYLGWDANLQIKVAIKEFLPREFAQRDVVNAQVVPYTEDAARYFETGLQQFIEEARTLAKFQQHPGVVSVLNFFRALGTGYIVMEFVDGETLKNYVMRGIGRLTWLQTLDVFMQVMDALRAVHQAGLLHCDIAPDNIYLCHDGRIKLLDFGEARHLMSAQAQRRLAVKPGFAAEEQYRSNGKLGAWTDVYGVAASMYYCLAGDAPPEVTERLLQDRLKPLHDYGVVIPDNAEHTLLLALSVRASFRPQSMGDLQHLLTSPNLQRASGLNSDRLLNSSNDPALGRGLPALRWRFWLMFCLLAFTLLFMLFRLASQMKSPQSMSETGIPLTQQETANTFKQDDVSVDWVLQRNREREAAETLQRQQEAALKRFEDYQLQNPVTVHHQSTQPETNRLEHLQRLCEEWGATMHCLKHAWEK